MQLFTQKERIEKMNSLNKQDSGVQITSPSLWIAIAGAILLIAAFVVWAFVGGIPQTMTIGGIYVGDGKCVCFTNLGKGKVIDTDMSVTVCPSTVSSQNYGSMIGVVTEVDDYATDAAELVGLLGSESLASYFLQSGPVSYVICTLQPDDSTVSGYKWSSAKGRDVELENGTYVTAQVTTEMVRPITLFFPGLE